MRYFIILQKTTADVTACDFGGRPPLHHLINSKQFGSSMDCLKILLKHGADINQTDFTGRTALHIAAVGAKAQRLKNLIDKDADLCLRNNAGQSGLHFAMKYLPHVTVSAINARLDRSITMATTKLETDAETEIRMDLNVVMAPPSKIKRPEPRSQVELYSELMDHHAGPSKYLVESVLKHPLSQIYLKLKWAQTQKFYYLFIVFTHLIYSMTYSMYSISVYRLLCPYPQDKLEDDPQSLTKDVKNFVLGRKNNTELTGTKRGNWITREITCLQMTKLENGTSVINNEFPFNSYNGNIFMFKG